MNSANNNLEPIFSIDEVRVFQTVDDIFYLLTNGRLNVLYSTPDDQYTLQVGGFTYHLHNQTNITVLSTSDELSYPSYVLPNSGRDYTIQIDSIDDLETLGNFETLLNKHCIVTYQERELATDQSQAPKEHAKEFLKQMSSEFMRTPTVFKTHDTNVPSKFRKHLPSPCDRLVGESEQPGRIGRLGMYEDRDQEQSEDLSQKKNGVVCKTFQKTMTSSAKAISRGIIAVGAFVERKANSKGSGALKNDSQENQPHIANKIEQMTPVERVDTYQDCKREIKASVSYTKKCIYDGLNGTLSKLGSKGCQLKRNNTSSNTDVVQ